MEAKDARKEVDPVTITDDNYNTAEEREANQRPMEQGKQGKRLPDLGVGAFALEGGGKAEDNSPSGGKGGGTEVNAKKSTDGYSSFPESDIPAGTLEHDGRPTEIQSQPSSTLQSSSMTREEATPPSRSSRTTSLPGAYPVGQSRPTTRLSRAVMTRNADGNSSNAASVPEEEGVHVVAELAEEVDALLLQEMEAQIRREYEDNTRDAAVVTEVVDIEATALKQRKLVFGGLLLLVLVVAIGTLIGIVVAPQDAATEDQVEAMEDIGTVQEELKPVLQTVRERGILRCKQEMFDGFNGEGFTTDLCKAISAAIFNDSSKFENYNVSFEEQFVDITKGELDVSVAQISLNMGRDIREDYSQAGFSYSTPYLYTGTGMAGDPIFLQCAQRGETFAEGCRDLKVCVEANSMTQEIVEALLPGSATVLLGEDDPLYKTLAAGGCNVIAGDGIGLQERYAREAGYKGDFAIADQFWSHEHLAFLMRDGDPQWAQFCDWILRALVTAEALNITQDNAEDIGTTDVFGAEYQNMFINAIAAVGNYGQIYEEHYGSILPRATYNKINTGDTGLLSFHPLGSLLFDEAVISEEDLPGPTPGGTLEAVVSRGHILCGIIPADAAGNPRSGFAELNKTTQAWSGIDVDYCKGLAASVFAGKAEDVVFVDLSDPETRFRNLANKTVDLIAGERFSMMTDVREPTTGQGFSFSEPYFYFDASDGGALALVTRQDDQQWSDLVNWMTQFTIYAEEKEVVQAKASELPVIELFGDQFKQMIRDTISAIGNYGEIYMRNLESHIPRSGRNLLNEYHTAQFFPIIPFQATQK